MTGDVNRESFIAAMDALGLTHGQAAARLGVTVTTIQNVCAPRVWARGVPPPWRAAVAKIIAEAARNGAPVAPVASMRTDDPIELPKVENNAGAQAFEADDDPQEVVEAAEPGGALGATGGDGDANDANPPNSLATGDAIACDALFGATAANVGAPFAPDVVRELAQLKQANRERFEGLLGRLRKINCPVGKLRRLIDRESGEADEEERDGRPPAQADILVALADDAELFQTPDGVAYADIEVNGHRESWSVKSTGFRRWLSRRFFEELGKAPNGETLATAIGVIEAKALHDTPVRDVFVRVGVLDGKTYLDLANDKWRAIEIDARVGASSIGPTFASGARPTCERCPSPLAAAQSMVCGHCSTLPLEKRATTTSSWRWHSSWGACAAVGLIRSWRSAASRVARNRLARRCCAT